MNRFDEVKRLKELEARAIPSKWSWSVDCENYQDGSDEMGIDPENEIAGAV